ncbi:MULTISPECIES: hypothetical protein [Cytobacillus]|uniref:Uncharacterized protein n=1 Tax=Cytobacillus stercorigallinarum TaxID=2762240 RepID=A0ABR8QN34_9BACI|nr:hypothetical protein [Cytobacillus stercorigallinarum]MBD7936941.1 hypothetical protein [Cytobacillus stercorigallinarum]
MKQLKSERKQKQPPQVNVEFGMEFGDMNASKIYDVTSKKGKLNKR